MATSTQAAPSPQAPPVTLEQIEEAERAAVLQAFAELKKRDFGELRIAIRLNRQTGHRELVYLGVHEQQDMTRLRKLYSQLMNGTKPVRF